MNTNSYKKAVVLGMAGITSLGIIRSLGEMGVDLYGVNITKTKGMGFYSKYLNKKFYTENGYSDDELIALFMENEELHDSVVFASHDHMVLFLLKNAGRLKEMNIVGIKSGLCGMELLNKHTIKKYAQKAGFNVPATYRYYHNSAGSVQYPVIVKPINSLRYTKKDAVVVKSKKDYNEKYQSLWDNEFIIEEYIDGGVASSIEVYGYRDQIGNTNIPCMVQKIRQYPSNNGTGSFVKTTFIPELIEPTRKFMKQIDLSGPFNIEVKYCHRRKKYYYIETNFRAGAQIYLVTKAGVNIPYCFMMGQMEKTIQCRDGIYWLDLIDVKNINKTVPLYVFLKDCFRADCYAGVSSRDFLQLIIYFLLRIRIYTKKYFKQYLLSR